MKHVAHYRCPECHHIIEKEQLFEVGCPLCGWASPLKGRAVSLARKGLDVKEPLTDVFDEPDCFRIVAELPGVAEADIETSFNPKSHSLVIIVPNHKYYKEIDLPSPANGGVTTSYRNGVLEVRVGKHGA